MTTVTVLWADDDENDLFLVEHALKGDGRFRYVSVSSGKAAIQYVAGAGEFADRDLYPFPSVLVLDVGMPPPSGLDVLVWLRTQSSARALPVVLWSGHFTPDQTLEAERLSAVWMQKPLGMRGINERLCEHIGKAMEFVARLGVENGLMRMGSCDTPAADAPR